MDNLESRGGRAEGKTFRVICAGLSMASAGESVRILANTDRDIRYLKTRAIGIIVAGLGRLDLPLDIKVDGYKIVFPNNGILQFGIWQADREPSPGFDRNLYDTRPAQVQYSAEELGRILSHK